MNQAALVQALRDSLATAYPASTGVRSTVYGASAVVVPSGGEYDAAAMCTPVPVTVTAEVVIVAAGTGDTAHRDLLGHIDPAAALIRAAGWDPLRWQAADVEDRPAITFTATAPGDG